MKSTLKLAMLITAAALCTCARWRANEVNIYTYREAS